MAKLSVQEELAIALKAVALDADPKKTSLEIAREFCAAEEELIAPFVAEWIAEKVARIIRWHRAKARHDANPQLLFEESLGFHHLPKKLAYKGKPLPRGESTIGAFRRLAVELRREDSPALKEALAAVALMEKYTPAKRTITWDEVVKHEAGAEKGKGKKAGKKEG